MTDEKIKYYEQIEEQHRKEQNEILGDMSNMTYALKNNSLMIQRIVRSDNKKLDKIEKVAEKQQIQLKKENDALFLYAFKQPTNNECCIVVVILFVFFFMSIWIILD